MIERSKNIPASYLILKKDDKILFVRRYNTGYEDGKYSLPAGHVEDGETFTECTIREAKEEIGIILEPNDLKVGHVMHSKKKKMEDVDRVDVYFIAKKWRGKAENKEPLKCDKIKWFKIENLPDNIIPCVRQAVMAIKKGIFYSEFGWE